MSLMYDRVRWEEKQLVRKAKERGLEVKSVDAKLLTLDSEVELKKLEGEFGDVVLQRCMSHFRGLHLSAFLESKGLSVVNKLQVVQVCGNKLLTTLALEKAGVPTPKTIISFTAESALASLKQIGYPAVLKPVTGSWGRMVVPLKDRRTAMAMIEMRDQMNGPLNHIYYIQEYVKRPPRDLRCIFVGDRMVTAVYRHAPSGEWRTNVARGGRVSPCPVTKELEDLVLKAAEAVGGGVLGVDAMEGREGLVVHEVNSRVEFQGASSASSVDIAGAIIDYVASLVKR